MTFHRSLRCGSSIVRNSVSAKWLIIACTICAQTKVLIMTVFFCLIIIIQYSSEADFLLMSIRLVYI